VILLVLGLSMYDAPRAALSQTLPGLLRLPWLVDVGGMFAAG
jgi:hypothetical protein